MIDTLMRHRQRAVPPHQTLARAGIAGNFIHDPAGYGVVTLHRPSNVDEAGPLRDALSILRDVAERLPLIWPLHPRARRNIERLGLLPSLANTRIALLAPRISRDAGLPPMRLVLTDSGASRRNDIARRALPHASLQHGAPITV
jgi:UDP-N-acetylglucosamine 2-epimerase (non-hydrolysing)